MKRALIYFVIAIFLMLVVQPNLNNTNEKTSRVPQNTKDLITTNENADIPQSQNKATICIDPGNGGQDHGFIIDEDLSEKDINLALAKKLGDSLQIAGYNIVYTRENDEIETFVQEADSANYRINTALDQDAEYFISLQMNDDENALMQGYSLFTQPDETMISLANAIHEKLSTISYSKFNGLDSDHYSNFPILMDKDLPSILIELGYLTNTEDLEKITDPDFQDKIIYAICEAIVEIIG